MPSYTVKAVVGQEPWSKDGRDFIGYELALNDLDHSVTLNQIPKTAAPQAGDVIEGDLKETPRGWMLKKAYGGQQSAPPGSQNGSGDEYARRPDHPDNVARMKHTASLSAAPAYYDQMRTEGVIEKPGSKAEYVQTIGGIVQWLEGTYPEPGEDLPPF